MKYEATFHKRKARKHREENTIKGAMGVFHCLWILTDSRRIILHIIGTISCEDFTSTYSFGIKHANSGITRDDDHTVTQ